MKFCIATANLNVYFMYLMGSEKNKTVLSRLFFLKMVENKCYRWPSSLDDFLNCLGGGGLFGRRQAIRLPSPTTNNPNTPPPDIWTSYEMTTSDGECSSLTISILQKNRWLWTVYEEIKV